MQLLRIVFSVCMSLLVNMPTCICGDIKLLDPGMEETPCHSHCCSDSNDDNEEAPLCNSSDHQALQFLLPDEEALFRLSKLDLLVSGFPLQDSTIDLKLFDLERITRPPPDTRRLLSTPRLHEIYSSYRL